MTTITEPKKFISLAERVAVSNPSFARPLRHRLIHQPHAVPTQDQHRTQAQKVLLRPMAGRFLLFLLFL